MKPAKILYFIDGPAPSPEDYKAATELSATVVFRNARAVPSEPHSLEIADGVAGKAPKIYADKYPTAEKAIAKKASELKALTSKVGDTPAPVAKTATTAKNAQQAVETGKVADAAKTAETQAPAPAADGGKPAAWAPNPSA